MAARALHGGTTGAVVPVRGRPQPAPDGEPDEQLLDEQSVVEEDDLLARRHLLIDEIRIVDCGDTRLVALPQDPTQLRRRHANPTGNHERRVAEIDEGHFPTLVDAPPVTKLRRQTGLAPVGHLGGNDRRHVCIVTAAVYKAAVAATPTCADGALPDARLRFPGVASLPA